jgi:chitinase
VNQWLDGGVPASKLLVGIPLYGRTYLLAHSTQHGLGAPINASGPSGPYTQEPGFLSYYEVFKPPIRRVWVAQSASEYRLDGRGSTPAEAKDFSSILCPDQLRPTQPPT